MSEEDNKKISKLKETSKKIEKLFSNKKVLLAITIILFSLILFTSVNFRLKNLESLKDATTGKYLPSDPDACYGLRVAQTLLDTGDISGIDYMRNPGLNLPYTQELLPKILVASYKIVKVFNPLITLDLVDVLYPTFAFAISLIIFFVLCWYLTKSKFVGVVASAILAYSPSYLSRTTTGISSHEALGMIFFFLSLLVFIFSLNNYKKSIKSTIIYGVLTGAALGLSVLSWSGASNFVLMSLPFAIFLYYLFGFKEEGNFKEKGEFVLFNVLWIVSSILIMPLSSNSFSIMYKKFITNYGVLIPFVLVFMIVDLLIQQNKTKLKFIKHKYEKLFALFSTIIVGIIFLALTGKNPLSLISGIYNQMLFPMGQSRVGLTVAYYSQPYLSQIISQYSPFIFWIFFVGMSLIGIEISKKINSKKNKIYFSLIWILSIIGLAFSRYSVNSILNGTNFISQLIYFASFILLFGVFGYLYYKKQLHIENETILICSWALVMLLSMRSAVRVLFLIYTFAALMVPYALLKIWNLKKETKDELLKIILFFSFWLILIILLVTLFGNPLSNSPGMYQITSYSARVTGSIAGSEWQNAMEWVRNNTKQKDIFIHWWDYGYLIQLIANRTTVLDGGNANAYWNHLFARYVLTTTKPDTALSFMKTHNVSYLLIDPTDFGKYGAYSKIGSDDNWDRFAYLENFLIDESQTTEKENSTILVYSGTIGVDEDLIINDGETIIPGPTYNSIGEPSYKAYIAAIIEEVNSSKDKTLSPSQPIAAVIYKNKQINIPIRYLYTNNKIIDYKTGIDSVFFLYPSINGNSMNAIGAGIYLSPKVSKSLFARLYLMNDPFNEYPTIKLAKTESSYITSSLKAQGLDLGQFIQYNGFQAPLKIWEVTYPENVLINSNFMKENAGYAEFDNDQVVR